MGGAPARTGAELVRLEVDVIVTGGAVAVHAVGQATASIPVVFAVSADPVAEGLVASLAKPGGNITGLTSYAGGEHAKGLELLKEVFPGLSRVGVLWDRSGPQAYWRSAAGGGRPDPRRSSCRRGVWPRAVARKPDRRRDPPRYRPCRPVGFHGPLDLVRVGCFEEEIP